MHYHEPNRKHRQQQTQGESGAHHQRQTPFLEFVIALGRRLLFSVGIHRYQIYEEHQRQPGAEAEPDGDKVAGVDAVVSAGACVVAVLRHKFLARFGRTERTAHGGCRCNDAAVVIPFAEPGGEFVVENLPAQCVGKHALGAIAGADHETAVLKRYEHYHAVVIVFFPGAPEIEKFGDVVVDILAVEVVDYHHDRLGRGGAPHAGKD